MQKWITVFHTVCAHTGEQKFLGRWSPPLIRMGGVAQADHIETRLPVASSGFWSKVEVIN